MSLYAAAFRAGLRPEPLLTVAEWADAHRQLSPRASAEPGRWRTERTPYLREIMEALSAQSPYRKVVLMAGAQLGKTEAGNNWIGYIIHHSPAPVMMLHPTLETAYRSSKQRLAPMIEATPVLSRLVREPRSRDSGNTLMVKEFPGGLLILAGANSPAGLRALPVRDLFADEVDAYPPEAGEEGDPVALAEKRTSTFAQRRVFLTSTPTIKGVSRIEAEFLLTDQRRYLIPCPECGAMDWLQWQAGSGPDGVVHHHIVWDGHDARTVRMKCSGCDALIAEPAKTQMLERGEWHPTAESKQAGLVGFHLSGLYSPLGWCSWEEIASEFLAGHHDPSKLKVWINTRLAETWEESGDSVPMGGLAARREPYPAEVPRGVGALVAPVDVQGDRLEVAVKGYGAGEESWLIAWEQIYGDPGQDEVWQKLAKWLARRWRSEGGRDLPLDLAVVDTGGLHTEMAYRFCAARGNRRVAAIKGGSIAGAPLVGRPSTNNRFKLRLYVLGVSAGKDTVMARMRITQPGPGYMHLPAWVDDEYLAQLTAEKAIRRYARGRGSVREWIKLRDRNEAFDLEVYALAALHILGRPFVADLGRRAELLAAPSEAPAPEAPSRPAPRRDPWVRRW